MSKKFNPQDIQQKYEQYRDLYRQIEAAQEQWKQAEKLWKEVQAYYQSGQWHEDHDESPSLKVAEGEYSILGEDTIWNALQDRQQQIIDWMRLGLDSLEER